jgi:predicted DNA-binding protein with PD1-like motif
MKRILLALTLLAAVAAAQETRTEKTSAPGAADARPNSDAVPAAYAIDTKFDRIVVVRCKYDTDLLAGLEGVVRQEKIRNAVILAGIGSVRGYHFHTVSNRDFPSKNLQVVNPTGPADIAGMSGYVIDGRVHAHVTFADGDRAFGGHLEPGTTVFTFAIVTLGVVSETANFERLDDKSHR